MAISEIFFFISLIVLLGLIPTQSALADNIEHGINFDRQIIDTKSDGTIIYKWTSTPNSAPRILDDSNNYKNYIITQDENNLYFDSIFTNLKFNKATCSLSVNDLTGQMVMSHSIKKAVNGTDEWIGGSENTEQCDWDYTTNKNGIMLEASRGEFKVMYDIDYYNGFEWTYQYRQTNPADNDKKIGFTFVCDGKQCDDIKLDGHESRNLVVTKQELAGKEITIAGHVFDTKDYIHDELWAIKESNEKLIVDFTDAKGPTELGEIKTVDPTFGYAAYQSLQFIQTSPTSGTQCSAGSTNGTHAAANDVRIRDSGTADVCVIQVGKFIIDTIPDTATIVSANFRHDRGAAGSSTNERMLVGHNMTADPQGSATSATKFTQGTQGNFIISPWTEPAANTNDIVRAFNSNGTTYIQSKLVANWVGLGIAFVSMTRDGSQHRLDAIDSWEIEITYSAIPPNSINTLSASGTTTTTTILSWSAPNLNGGTIQRYVFNYTTPCGIPNTFLANGTTATTYTVSSLNPSTCYSFRVSAATEAGKNITGANIVNVTTSTFNQANFTIGSFNYNADNPLRLPILFSRYDSGSQAKINITYSSTITNLSCDLRKTYAGTNTTYHNIAGSSISSTQKRAQFVINNSTNDIITFRCWNQNGNQSANYVVTQNNFLLKQQIQQFRNGTFGTFGQLGAFDFVSLVIIVIVMIGLNKNNEAVGGIFALIGISIMAYFEIVNWVTAIIAAIVFVTLVIVSSVRKD